MDLTDRDLRIQAHISDLATLLRPYVDQKVRQRILTDLATPLPRKDALAAAAVCFAAGITVTNSWTPTSPLMGCCGALECLSQAIWPRALKGKRLVEVTDDAITEEAQHLANAWVNISCLPALEPYEGEEPLLFTWANEFLREPEALEILAEIGDQPPPLVEALRLLSERAAFLIGNHNNLAW